MILISHRVNTTEKLRKVDFQFGVEIDIRSNNNQLILHHDPFEKGELFKEWLENYNHKILILNVKEEGLENRILTLLREKKINNFFFLDQSFPFLIKLISSGSGKTAVRFSEYESIETVLSLAGKVDWVWIDSFRSFQLDIDKYKKLKEKRFKLCLVSPELQGREKDEEIYELANFLNENEMEFDAICSKKIELWKRLSDEY